MAPIPHPRFDGKFILLEWIGFWTVYTDHSRVPAFNTHDDAVAWAANEEPERHASGHVVVSMLDVPPPPESP